ncbi:MAG TPA: hypothetical protein VHM20_03775, partial [Gammaproteobacteria bacterium]|nr:hypothetical protein [Gammaproteobacteria bacterium]
MSVQASYVQKYQQMRDLFAFLFSGLFTLASFDSTAQTMYRADSKIQTELLQDDFRILRTVLENVHIGLYR